jgi:hypothetical protein
MLTNYFRIIQKYQDLTGIMILGAYKEQIKILSISTSFEVE